jgi:hypothetical protein
MGDKEVIDPTSLPSLPKRKEIVKVIPKSAKKWQLRQILQRLFLSYLPTTTPKFMYYLDF